jgi:hypothetical protein
MLFCFFALHFKIMQKRHISITNAETPETPTSDVLCLIDNNIVNMWDSGRSHSETTLFSVPASVVTGTIAEEVLNNQNGFISIDVSGQDMKNIKFHPKNDELKMWKWIKESLYSVDEDSQEDQNKVRVLFSSTNDEKGKGVPKPFTTRFLIVTLTSGYW